MYLYIKRVLEDFQWLFVTLAQWIRVWHLRETQFFFLLFSWKLKSIWIWDNKPSSNGSKLLFTVIKAHKFDHWSVNESWTHFSRFYCFEFIMLSHDIQHMNMCHAICFLNPNVVSSSHRRQYMGGSYVIPLPTASMSSSCVSFWIFGRQLLFGVYISDLFSWSLFTAVWHVFVFITKGTTSEPSDKLVKAQIKTTQIKLTRHQHAIPQLWFHSKALQTR